MNIKNEPLLVGKNNKVTQNRKQKGKNKELENQQIITVKAAQNNKGKGNKKYEVKEKTGKIVKAKQNGTAKGKEKKVEESYLIENLINDKIINVVWKIKVKWKGHKITTWEPISSLKRATIPKKKKLKRMTSSLY